MKDQRLLYLSARQMTAWRWRRGALIREAAFSPGDEGARQFARYLAENPKSVFSLLANVPDEGFHLETIPWLRGADRRAVIRRKLAQAFSNAPLCAAFPIGQEKNQRKDERLLLAALNDTAFFQPWLDALRAADAVLAGIYSLPLLAPALFKKLRLPQTPCLLLSTQDESVRQSFFDKGALNFSRLTFLPPGGAEVMAQTFAAEAARLQQYLASQRLIGRGQVITAHILAHPDAFQVIRAHCADTPDLRFNLLDIGECARRIGFKAGPLEPSSESLFLHLLAVGRPGVQFAGEELRRDFRLAQIRSLLRGASATILAVCLLLSASNLFDAREIAGDAEALRVEAAASRRRHEDIVKTFPPLPVDNETLKRVIGAYLVQEQRGATLVPLYREISRALRSEPEIEIDRLDWRVGGAQTGAAGNPGAPPPEGEEESESLVARGTLRLDAGATARQALAAFDRFVAALRANAALDVEILQTPFGIASDTALRGGGRPRDGEEKPWDFSVRVTRKPDVGH